MPNRVPKRLPNCLIAFGSNEGKGSDTFAAAIENLRQSKNIEFISSSQPTRTTPVGGPPGQDDFLNAAILIQTSLSPHELHLRLIEIENELGRQRRSRWGARKIDLDLLLYDNLQLQTSNLEIPHPRMSFRMFVLGPASEIAGEMIHPDSGLTINELKELIQTRPDEILVVIGKNDDELVNLIEVYVSMKFPDWKFQMARQISEFDRLQSTAKLVTHFEAESCGKIIEDSTKGKRDDFDSMYLVTMCLVNKAKMFRGPRLALPRNLDRASVELLAAIEALAPSQRPGYSGDPTF